MKKIGFIILAAVLASWAQFDDDEGSSFKFTGYAAYQGGHVVSGTYKYSDDISMYWFQKAFANVGFIKKVSDWVSIAASIEASYRPSFQSGNTFPESQIFIPHVYIDQARGDITFLNTESTNLRLTTGYFHFSYNPDITNLGNNLFRSYCYPTAIVQSEFDFPVTRLLGFDFHASLFNGMLYNDLLFTSSIHYYPAGDFSLTDIIGTKPFRGINFAAGIQLDRLLAVNDSVTTPKDVASRTNPETGDTTFYTYAGTKIMAVLNLDIKRLIFGDDYPSIFGEEDAKLFGELNILGLKNYYYWYDTLAQRIPISFGVKIPAFKILDVLSLEFEYFGSHYPNSYDRPLNANLPYPEVQEISYNAEDWVHDDWKWSLYARKTLFGITLIGQVARDHLQLWSYRPVDQIFHDNLVQPKDWYYQFKIMYKF